MNRFQTHVYAMDKEQSRVACVLVIPTTLGSFANVAATRKRMLMRVQHANWEIQVKHVPEGKKKLNDKIPSSIYIVDSLINKFVFLNPLCVEEIVFADSVIALTSRLELKIFG